MIEWIGENTEWLFSGVGVVVIGLAVKFAARNKGGKSEAGVNINITNSNNVSSSVGAGKVTEETQQNVHADERVKQNTRILFVDDDTRFKVVKILINAGWSYVKIVKDISSLVQAEIVEADILFIDIQGVGKLLGFSDEGLGLALALKQKYPNKKVVIYSSQTTGERFHQALRIADDSLPKNADPYEFIRIVDEFSER